MTFTQTKPDSPAHHYGEKDRKKRQEPQRVYVVVLEHALDADGCCVCGVYATQALAEAAAEKARDECESTGRTVYERLPEGEECDWDYSVTIEEHEVKAA